MAFAEESTFFVRPDLIETLNLSRELSSVQRLRDERTKIFDRPSWQEKVLAIAQTPLVKAQACDFSRATIKIGDRTEIPATDSTIERAIESLMPWRKGPFEIFGYRVDAEWQSDMKWSRIEKVLGDLRGKRILDVGCGNGYYMLRAAAHDPVFVLGLDPSPNFWLQFELFQKHLQLPYLQLELLGHEHLHFFHKTFDLALCMGILYHHSDPVETLRRLKQTLRNGGRALIESQAIEPLASGDRKLESMAIFPKERYAKARNVFFVPTADCLIHWAQRAGFVDVELVSFDKVTPVEQRKTRHMVFESLADFLDPDDSTKTVEGYPAPHRAAIIATRP